MFKKVFIIILLLLIVCASYLGYTAHDISVAAQITPIDKLETREAIVVMGAAQWNGKPSPVFKSRLDHATTLYENNIAPVVVVTGGEGFIGEKTEAKVGYEYLRQQGIPDEDLMLEVQGRSTWQSLQASARFLKNNNISKVVLVSDGWHLARAKAMAAEVGLEATTSAITSTPLNEGQARKAFIREVIALGAGRLIGFHRLDRLVH